MPLPAGTPSGPHSETKSHRIRDKPITTTMVAGMTRLSHRRSSLRRTLAMLGLAIGLAGCGEASGEQKKDSRMTQPDRTLWQTIDALAQQIPISKAKVETVLGVGLVDRDT